MSMLKQISKVAFTDRVVPFVLLFAVFVSFGLLIPWLGFYWDDWPVLYLTQTQGVRGFWDFYQYDRPFSAWTYILLTPVLGVSAIAWHVFVLGLRWMTAVFVWLTLRMIWREKLHSAFWTAALFAVCPLFLQQQMAVAYSQHWICYLLYFASLYCMLRAQENQRRYFLFTSLAILFEWIHLFTMEYFMGLEVIRLVVLMIYARERNRQTSIRSVVGLAVKHGSVYYFVLAIFITWRVFFLQLPTNDVNTLVLASDFLASPLQTLRNLLQIILQDVFHVLTVWVSGVNPADFNLARPFSLAVIALGFFASFVLFVCLRAYRRTEYDELKAGPSGNMILLGVLAILFGILPVWIIGRQAALGGDRFTFAAMFGVCLTIVGILEWLTARHQAKIVVICALIALALHTNLYTADAYQAAWEKQQSFYWQLFWRAPSMQPHTALIAEGEFLPFVGRYSASMAISMLYPSVPDARDVPYWIFNYLEGLFRIPDKLLAGHTIKESLRNYSFAGDSRDAILVGFDPELGRCLQIYSAQDQTVKELPASLQNLSEISNTDRIGWEMTIPGWVPPVEIFGFEPEHQWCFYYQKAELASQYQNWNEVIRLLEEARARGFTPDDKKEYLVFSNAYIRLNEFDKALDLNKLVKGDTQKNNDSLCMFWNMQAGLLTQSDFTLIYDQIKTELDCVN